MHHTKSIFSQLDNKDISIGFFGMIFVMLSIQMLSWTGSAEVFHASAINSADQTKIERLEKELQEMKEELKTLKKIEYHY